MIKKSLITGGAGFIGSHVAKKCLEDGHFVVIIDDLSGGFLENIPQGAIFIEGSITDTKLINEIFEKYQFDYVYHLAAYAAEGLSHFIRKYNYENNLIGSINLLNESVKHKIKCFVFTSSIAVYGAGQLPMLESTVPCPEDPYGISKYAFELDLKAAKEMFGLDYIIFRPHNVYGENQNIGDKYRNVIGIFMNQLMQDLPLTIFGDGNQTRAFSYISDVAPYISSSVENHNSYNEIINIGAETPYSINQLVKAVAKEFNVTPKITYLKARKEVEHAYSSHSKAKSIFNIESFTELEEGINKMATWVKKEGARSSKPFQNIEITTNLPDGW